MRVLHVADFAAPYPGAFIRQLCMLDDELRAAGWDPTAFAFAPGAEGADWVEQLRERGCPVEFLPAGSTRLQRDVARRIADLVDRHEATVLHSHFGTYDLSVEAAARQARSRPTLIWHYRTALEEPVSSRGVRRRLKDWVKYARAGARVDACVAVTEALAEEVAARGMGERARAVVAGCDTDTFRPDPAARADVRRDLGLSEKDVLVLHMGWQWHRKGGDLLARAAHQLRDRGHGSIVFASVGAAEGELEEPVISLPFTPQIQRLHAASDLFVSASRSEGFGNGLVEAMSCGRVAVATLVAGQQETFLGAGDGCRTIAPEDPTALADAIASLLDARESWERWGAANREFVVANLSMRRWARDMADVYRELLDHPTPTADPLPKSA